MRNIKFYLKKSHFHFITPNKVLKNPVMTKKKRNEHKNEPNNTRDNNLIRNLIFHFQIFRSISISFCVHRNRVSHLIPRKLISKFTHKKKSTDWWNKEGKKTSQKEINIDKSLKCYLVIWSVCNKNNFVLQLKLNALVLMSK